MAIEATEKTAALAGIWSSSGLVPIEAWLDHHGGVVSSSLHTTLWLATVAIFFFIPVFVFVIGFGRPSFGRFWFLIPEGRAHHFVVSKRMFVWFVSAGATAALWSLALSAIAKAA